MTPTETIDWTAYAREYDLLMDNSPAYQELVCHCRSVIRGWLLAPGAVVADIGAGTGNFSVTLASDHRRLTVLHVEDDEGMIHAARAKAEATGLTNWSVIKLDLNHGVHALPPLDAVVSVNALYTLLDPAAVIGEIADKLRPGGRWYACDLGRRMRVWDWGVYLVLHAIRRHGVARTIRLFRSTGSVWEQNRRISELQVSGRFWLHHLPEFRQAFTGAGLEVFWSSARYYRGYCDVVIARKR